MRFGLFLIFTLGFPLPAQITGLATTDDGSLLYFSTSSQQRDTAQAPHAKIFRWDTAGLRLYAERLREPGEGPLTNYYALLAPSVSGNGRLVAFTGRRDCFGGQVCGFRNLLEGAVQSEDSRPVHRTAGAVRLSRNGRYAVFGDLRLNFPTLVDLATGAATPVRVDPRLVSGPLAGRQIVADNGAVVLGQQLWISDPEPPAMLRARGRRLTVRMLDLPTKVRVHLPVISASADIVVYESFPQPGQQRGLFALDLATGRQTLLFVAPQIEQESDPINYDRPLFQASLRSDGRRVLFLGSEGTRAPRRSIFVIQSDGSEGRLLASIPEGVREATLSGDGSVAYAVTELNRLLRIDVSTGVVTELISRTPWIAEITGAALPGSTNRIRGGAFVERSFFAEQLPLPTSLGGLRVEYGGQPTVLEKVAPDEIVFQIPWEASISSDAAVQVLTTAQSAFTDPRETRGERALLPQFESPGIFHENGTLVSSRSPVEGGEVIHVLLTGLGAVRPPAVTGVVSPRDPPSLVTVPVGCAFQVGGRPAGEILFAGLAPGRIGIYQITLRTPPTLPAGGSTTPFSCGFLEPGGFIRGPFDTLPLAVSAP